MKATLNSQRVEKLLSDREIGIYNKYREDSSIMGLTRLKSFVERARKLRNKYVDLSQRQSRKGTDKVGPPKRTLEKARIFQKILRHFEAKLEKKKSSIVRKKAN